jgi:hypothetical protein
MNGSRVGEPVISKIIHQLSTESASLITIFRFYLRTLVNFRRMPVTACCFMNVIEERCFGPFYKTYYDACCMFMSIIVFASLQIIFRSIELVAL